MKKEIYNLEFKKINEQQKNKADNIFKFEDFIANKILKKSQK